MKAIAYRKYGSPDVLALAEIPKPRPERDEVLVRVHAASVSAADLDLLHGVFMVRPGGIHWGGSAPTVSGWLTSPGVIR